MSSPAPLLRARTRWVGRFSRVLSTRDYTELEEVLAPDFVSHNGGTDAHGVDGWRDFIEDGWREYGPIEPEIIELLEDGPLIAERWRISSTGDGKPVLKGHGITVHPIADGRMQEDWAVFTPE